MGGVDFIWIAAVLHVLSEADCKKFLANAKLLLKPGGAIYGWNAGSTQPKEWADTPDGRQKRFLHSPVRSLLCLYSNMCLHVHVMYGSNNMQRCCAKPSTSTLCHLRCMYVQSVPVVVAIGLEMSTLAVAILSQYTSGMQDIACLGMSNTMFFCCRSS